MEKDKVANCLIVWLFDCLRCNLARIARTSRTTRDSSRLRRRDRLRAQHPAVNLHRPDAELSLKLQRLLQPIQKKVDNFHCTPTPKVYAYFFPYPYGFRLCHFHASAHISAMPRFAFHLSSFAASAGSAQHSAMSPGRRGRIL